MIRPNAPRMGVLPEQWSPEMLAAYPFNAGLLHARFLGLPATKTRSDEAGDARSAAEAFRDAVQAAGPRQADRLAAAHRRLDALGGLAVGTGPSGAWDHWYVDLRTEARLAIGLGNVHPLENGLTFHHTLGVPFIPGTAVKGAVRAWAKLQQAAGDARPLSDWFGEGPTARDGGRVGALSFLDALPLDWPELEVDLVNCHLPAFYRGRANPGAVAKANPGAVAKESPVPAVFLVVREGVRFRFRVGRRPGRTAPRDAQTWAEEALELLREVGLFAGLGSKTSAGYGYFG